MKHRIVLIIVFLALAGGGATFAARQHRVAAKAEAASIALMQRTEALRARVAAANANNTALEQELKTKKAATETSPKPAPASASTKNNARSDGGSRDPRGSEAQRQAAIAEAMAIARVRRLVALETDVRPYFERLGLTPAQWEDYEKLLLEQFDAGHLAAEAARARGENPDAVRAAGAKANPEIEAKARELVGDAAYAQLREFQAAAPVRLATRRLQNHLLLSADALTATQSRQVETLLAAKSTELATSVGIMPNDDTLAAASEFLSARQITAWRRIRDAQELARRTNDLAYQQAAASRR